ncbi:hypothetical protein VTJ49DRAFT_4926 [Mycothermus thermophilus]|uniref:Uncharacterized protein n=1 Tax=Humicola insolens TaxID=85995 RepID=A0ABR3V476_HUMIN
MAAPEPNPLSDSTLTTNPNDDNTNFLLTSYTHLRRAIHTVSTTPDQPILPSHSAVSTCLASLPTRSSPTYLQPHGATATHTHLLTEILPALNLQSLSPRYFGFVTGGVLPVAEAADNLVSAADQNVQVYFPVPDSQGDDDDGGGGGGAGAGNRTWTHSASTAIEDAALRMLIDLLNLDPDPDPDPHPHPLHTTTTTTTTTTSKSKTRPSRWPARTFTTGATASNILGLACARDALLLRRDPSASVSELGLIGACRVAGVREIRILAAAPHSSIGKAASVVGLGRGCVRDVGLEEEPWRLDLDVVERELRMGVEDGVVHVIVVGAGEVNTGRFGTGVLDMPKLRSLGDKYGAWIHVDGAFGLFARVLPKTDEFLELHAGVAGLELADSIAADGHKLLNVPYDAGIFLCRDASIATQVFGNHNAAYLSSTPSTDHSDTVISPLNLGLENSRRFRALPVYAVLLSEGRSGIAAMLMRMVRLARAVASFVRESKHYELLPADHENESEGDGKIFIIVLFRARDPALNDTVVDRINASGKMFVSGTVWEGRKAARIAVGSWRVDVERDVKAIKAVLTEVAEGFAAEGK